MKVVSRSQKQTGANSGSQVLPRGVGATSEQRCISASHYVRRQARDHAQDVGRQGQRMQLGLGAPAADRRHVGLDRGLVDDDETLGRCWPVPLPASPVSARQSILLTGVQAFEALAFAVQVGLHRTMAGLRAARASSAIKPLMVISGLVSIRSMMMTGCPASRTGCRPPIGGAARLALPLPPLHDARSADAEPL